MSLSMASLGPRRVCALATSRMRVPERGPDVVPERAGVARFEGGQAVEHLDHGVLHQILGFHRPAGGGRQPAVGPAPQPGLVAGEEGVHGGLVAGPGEYAPAPSWTQDRRPGPGVGGADATGAGFVHGRKTRNWDAERANHTAFEEMGGGRQQRRGARVGRHTSVNGWRAGDRTAVRFRAARR